LTANDWCSDVTGHGSKNSGKFVDTDVLWCMLQSKYHLYQFSTQLYRYCFGAQAGAVQSWKCVVVESGQPLPAEQQQQQATTMDEETQEIDAVSVAQNTADISSGLKNLREFIQEQQRISQWVCCLLAGAALIVFVLGFAVVVFTSAGFHEEAFSFIGDHWEWVLATLILGTFGSYFVQFVKLSREEAKEARNEARNQAKETQALMNQIQASIVDRLNNQDSRIDHVHQYGATKISV
jgi:hypothetical protein